MQLASNIKLVRLLLDETQPVFIKRFVGVTTAMQKSYEGNKANPDPLYMERLADLAGVSISQLTTKKLKESDITLKVKKVEKVTPRETDDIDIDEVVTIKEVKGTDDYYRTKYIESLERTREQHEKSFENHAALVTANLTELLASQKYNRAQLTALLRVTSLALAKLQNREDDAVLEETSKNVDDLILALK